LTYSAATPFSTLNVPEHFSSFTLACPSTRALPLTRISSAMTSEANSARPATFPAPDILSSSATMSPVTFPAPEIDTRE